MRETNRKKMVLRVVLGIVGALLLAGGIRKGEYEVTRNKAANVCTECIGIG